MSTSSLPQHGDGPATALEKAEDHSMFERMARDPSVDVGKLAGLMALWERNEARKAETAFNGAMSEAQTAMRPVDADASNPQTHSKYASYSAIDKALRPIYTRHGFGLSFDTADSPVPEHVRVLCYVTHSCGHARTYHIDMPNDGKGARGGDVMTKTHATGSAITYGMRYLLKMIFNVAIGEDDDDGNRAGARAPRREPPTWSSATPRDRDGYEAWLETLDGLASRGEAAWDEGWSKSPEGFCKHLAATDAKTLASLRTKARKAGR